MYPEGDMVILNVPTKETHCYRFTGDDEWADMKEVSNEEAKVSEMTVLMAKYYGPQPTDDEPWLAMARFG
jgi:hypothetical protein